MANPDFSDVFGGEGGGGDVETPAEDMGEGDDAESEEALDAAIDEAMTSDDPVTRREAFKTAVRLCKEPGY